MSTYIEELSKAIYGQGQSWGRKKTLMNIEMAQIVSNDLIKAIHQIVDAIEEGSALKMEQEAAKDAIIDQEKASLEKEAKLIIKNCKSIIKDPKYWDLIRDKLNFMSVKNDGLLAVKLDFEVLKNEGLSGFIQQPNVEWGGITIEELKCAAVDSETDIIDLSAASLESVSDFQDWDNECLLCVFLKDTDAVTPLSAEDETKFKYLIKSYALKLTETIVGDIPSREHIEEDHKEDISDSVSTVESAHAEKMGYYYSRMTINFLDTIISSGMNLLHKNRAYWAGDSAPNPVKSGLLLNMSYGKVPNAMGSDELAELNSSISRIDFITKMEEVNFNKAFDAFCERTAYASNWAVIKSEFVQQKNGSERYNEILDLFYGVLNPKDKANIAEYLGNKKIDSAQKHIANARV